MRVWSTLWLLIFLCSACRPSPPPPVQVAVSPASTTSTPVSPVLSPTSLDPTETQNPSTATAAKPTIPAVTQLPRVGERIAFQAEDGTALMGEYFPAKNEPASAVILMHPLNSNRRVWVRKGVVSWLNNTGQDGLVLSTASPNALNWLPLPDDVSTAVFIFDFRGHGESQGGRQEMSDYLMDARAALAVVRGLPGIDPQRIALIGASLGADTAADLCQEGCVGALGLSPGGHTGIPYTDAVAQMNQLGKPAWCLASSGDTRAARACVSASGELYRSLVYSGSSAHGVDLLVPGFNPDITVIFREFILQVFNF